MRFACWITYTANTHSECVILTACPLQSVSWRAERVLNERDSRSACFHFDSNIYMVVPVSAKLNDENVKCKWSLDASESANKLFCIKIGFMTRLEMSQLPGAVPVLRWAVCGALWFVRLMLAVGHIPSPSFVSAAFLFHPCLNVSNANIADS
jgi:hypothetical protein